MAWTAAAGCWLQTRGPLRARWRLLRSPALGLAAFLFAAMFAGDGHADPIKGNATLSAANGFARLVLKLDDDVDTEVTVAGTILVIHFKKPVDIPVDQLSDAVPDYVGSARIDPDGSAIRLALARKVTVNTMTAGERVFVDLLPDGWKGAPPGLPMEVVRELAERARAAERALREQRAVDQSRKRPPIRVRASVQPTFVRLVFELPSGASVSSALNEQKLSLLFNQPLNFDLADAREAAPANVASIGQKIENDKAVVDIRLIGDVDVHSFREEKNFVVDIGAQQSDQSALPPLQGVARAISAAAAAGKDAVKPATDASVSTPPSPRKVEDIPPPTSQSIAAEAGIVIKPGAAAAPAPPKPAAVPAQLAPPVKTDVKAPHGTAPVLAPAPKAAAASPTPSGPTGGNAATVSARRSSDGLRLTFGFNAPTPVAVFRRADAAWLVFDSDAAIDLAPIRREAGALIADIDRRPLTTGQAIRIHLNRPQLASLSSGDPSAAGSNPPGETWTVTFSDAVQNPSQPLDTQRNVVDPTHASVTIPLRGPGRLHRIVDPDAGDALMVVTALPPARGFIKHQDFVEFSLLESTQGVVIQPHSDDVAVDVGPDKVTLSRPGGLTLSPASVAPERAASAVRPIFDVEEWERNQKADFFPRQSELIRAAAESVGDKAHTAARLDLARFYMAHGLFHEAKGVLDLALSEQTLGQESPVLLIVHSVASSLTGYTAAALRDLANPAIGTGYDSQLWKAVAEARQHKWAEAREKFKTAQFAITALPIDLQRIIDRDAMRASLEVKDFSGAAMRSSDLDAIGVPADMKPSVTMMRGWLAESLGQERDALADYAAAVASPDRQAAAEGRVRQIALLQKRGEIKDDDALRDLETLAVMWRGDGIEVRTLQMLMALYTKTGRYADALAVARAATKLQPNSAVSRKIQDDASALFSQLYLGPRGDALPPIDALAMFYDYRDLTPIGSRGDEMIRRLADRLVSVDLLDQASELLQYQIDHRLEGAARAQVAARLATVYLMNRKPDRAIAALRSTRIADLAGELRQQRLLLEARAQSDIGRHDLALDIISNLTGREAIRLRSDIYWASRRWREASEQIELYYGDRWRDFKPLSSAEKSDIIRAVIGYALAEDALGLARFREKYAPLMSGTADKLAFDTASKPAAGNNAEFAQIAKMAAQVDTLEGFLREMKQRFPDMNARASQPADAETADPAPTGSLPQIAGTKQVEAAR
ncbi:MAG TPA: tetratricopeptide repeat protein [Nitrobacter sp.]|nr:tetratricopeptide repeat protein [Nitrobacter sp.]